MATNVPVTLDTLIALKIQFRSTNLKFKVPLRDLGAHVLPDKLRTLLKVPTDQDIVFERYSDSAGAYITLDSTKPQIYKSLFRAAKAKLKLRLRATIPGQENAVASPPEFIPTPSERLIERLAAVQRPSTDTLSALRTTSAASPVIARTPVAPQPNSTEQETEVETTASPMSPPVTQSIQPEASDEAPVPRAFTASQGSIFTSQKPSTSVSNLAFRPKTSNAQTTWVVYCNNCNLPMEDEHFHCSICDHGDYDLCPSCVDNNVHCPGSNHWMVRRFVKNGCVVNSTTERVGPKATGVELTQPQIQTEKAMPGTFTEEKQMVEVLDLNRDEEPTRTCNCCVQVQRETEFVTCTSCEDYDLCMECHIRNKHGHHPGHAFKAATAETSMPALGDFLCNAGRNVRHSAVCDGCEKFIYGVRHKCLNCPDWDFCPECVKSAKHIHPGHRFVPIYEPLAEPAVGGTRHYGIYCDGPLCKDKENQSYIEGVRYKCAVCNDTDFCANCEAHPTNRHNHTHPLIKFKRPVRSVSVTTLNEDKNGNSVTRVGDCEPSRRPGSSETLSPSNNAATQVQTIADLKPVEHALPRLPKSKITVQDLLSPSTESKADETQPEKALPIPILPSRWTKDIKPLDAHFIRDVITDGSKIATGKTFVQVWTLQNPGPATWPAGCSVRHVGGDNMLNIDNTQPLSQSDLAEASESNVIGWPVAPGQEVSFRVVMKAPMREGVAISYWRLKTADGLPFGHRLWCDIHVVAPIAQPVHTVPEVSRDASSMVSEEKIALLQQQKTIQERINMEKILRIQKVRKAAVERLLENRRKEYEAHKQAACESELTHKAAPKATAELPVEEKAAKKAAEPEPHSSGMIFPQLDKESPASSTHEALSIQPQSPPSEVAPAGSTADHSEEEFFEDAESVDIRSASSDDGFMTDEEYDILDASDEDMP